MDFAAPQWVHLAWPALAVVMAAAYLELRTGETLAQFMSLPMQARLAWRQTRARRIAKLSLFALTLALGVVALMRPQSPTGTEVLSQNITADIMIVLDVSKSMLAEDAAPNRLARAKAEINELLERVDGQRVGLVVFAGRAAVKSPLTSDYGFFRLVLRDVNVGSVSRGGTRIGDAVRRAVAVFGPDRGTPRIMLLITDGEDHDSYPLEAVEEAVGAGVRIVAIGFGSETGSEVLLTDPDTGARNVLLDSDGNAVRSRLDGDLLREIALAAEGRTSRRGRLRWISIPSWKPTSGRWSRTSPRALCGGTRRNTTGGSCWVPCYRSWRPWGSDRRVADADFPARREGDADAVV